MSAGSKVLRLHAPRPPADQVPAAVPDRTIPRSRGRAMDPAEIALTFYSDKVTPRWVREHLPRQLRVPGTIRPPLYFEFDVRDHLEAELAAARQDRTA